MRRFLGLGLLFLAGVGLPGPGFAVTPPAANPWIDPAYRPAIEAVTLRNAACEAVVWTKPFVRIASFRLTGGQNRLAGFDTPNPVEGPRVLRPWFVCGAKLWLAGLPGGDRFGLLPGTATRTPHGVEIALGPDPATGLAARIRVELAEKEARLTVASLLRNAGDAERTTACWWPVSFEPGGTMSAEALPEAPGGAPHFQSWNGDAPPAEPACRIEGTRVTLDLDRPMAKPLFQLGFPGREIAVAKPDGVHRLDILAPLPGPGRRYPPGGGSVIVFRDQRTGFCEAELCGPLTALAPGEETSFSFSWALDPVPSGQRR